MTAAGPVRLGLVGYGLGGRYFHAPFIAAAVDVELSAVVTRDPVRRAEVGHDWPGVPVFDTQADLLGSGLLDAVTITTYRAPAGSWSSRPLAPGCTSWPTSRSRPLPRSPESWRTPRIAPASC